MTKKGIYQYYVEGEDEKCIIDVLKRDLGCIVSGKVDKLNVVQEKINITRTRLIKPGTVVILVYDTDVGNTDILQENITFLQKQKVIKDVLCIPQVKNLEDELCRACQIKSVAELTHSATRTDYKRDLLRCTNLEARLLQCQFDISKFWNRLPQNKFKRFGNDSEKIKK